MKATLIIISLLIFNSCFSQNDSTIDNRVALKFCISSLHVPYVGRSFRTCIEYRIKPFYSIENEAGLFFDNSKGYMFRTDIKKYLENYNDGTYISIDLFHKFQTYSASDTIFGTLTDYHVKKNIVTLSFKYGRVISFKFGLLVDLYCGIGIKFQQNKNTLSKEENANMPPLYDYNTNWILNREQNKVYPNLLAGLKIGYILN
jgi:hypothetical protein